MARYRRDLAAYMQAQASYAAAAEAYWSAIAEKRHLRAAKRASREPISLDDYVLTQPPVYSGPPKPHDPSKPHEEAPPPVYVPVVADFLAGRSANSNLRRAGRKTTASSNAPTPGSRWRPG